jgi:hypothetical protein
MPPAQATIEGPTVCAVDHSWDSNPGRDGICVTSTSIGTATPAHRHIASLSHLLVSVSGLWPSPDVGRCAVGGRAGAGGSDGSGEAIPKIRPLPEAAQS